MPFYHRVLTRKQGSNFRRFLLACSASFVILLLAFAFVWQYDFDKLGGFLIDLDRPEKADLIFILGGDAFLRAPLAANLYKQGYAPKMLLAREPTYYYPDRTVNFTESTIQILTSAGVPRDRITDFGLGAGVRSTADEARALRLYVNEYPVKNLLVVTSVLHSRRARMAMNRALTGTGVQLRMVCAGPRTYDKSEERQAKVEVVKTIWYFFTFFG